MYMPNSQWTWSFALIALAQAIISLALEGYVFAKFETSLAPGASKKYTQAQTIPTYLALFIFGFIYQLILVYDALQAKNTIQIIGLCMYNLGMLIYGAVQMNQIDEAILFLQTSGDIADFEWMALKPYLIAVPCVIALGTTLLSFIAWKLYQEFAWTIYKDISADLRIKRRYLTYQIYIALLKFDFFFFLGFTVQFLVIVGHRFTDAEFYLTIVAVPVTIAILFLAGWVTRRESYPLQATIIFIYFAAMAYFVFKLVRMYDQSNPEKVLEYGPARKSLTWFAIITILLLIITIMIAALCTRNFYKGLKPYLQKKKPGRDPEAGKYGSYETGNGGGYGPSSHQLANVPTRLSID